MKLKRSDGSTASVLSTDGDRALLSADKAAPPGSPLKLERETGGVLELKVRNCYRDKDDGDFRIEGRWVSLSKADRQALLAATHRE